MRKGFMGLTLIAVLLTSQVIGEAFLLYYSRSRA